jgi:type I restriction enzyme S subunit
MPEWIDRTKWKRVKLGEACEEISERINDPANQTSARFVGLEHMDSGELKVRRWGSPERLESAMKLFRAGDVLFARRNAYLKRASLVDFDGICSGDAIVLRENNAVVSPGYLALVLNTEKFWEFAIANAAGTMSRRVNGKTLANYEFDLPPLDQQRRIAEVLRSSVDIIERKRTLLNSIRIFSDAFVYKRMRQLNQVDTSLAERREYEGNGWIVATGQSLLDKGILVALKDGNHGEQYPRSSEFSELGTPYVAASNISDEGIIDFQGSPKLPDKIKNRLRIPPARAGDVLLTHNATVGRVAIIPDSQREVVASTTTTYYRANPSQLSNQYLATYLRSSVFQTQLHRVMKQSTRDQVPISAQKKLFFVIPPLEFQNEFIGEVTTIENAINAASLDLEICRRLTLELTSFLTHS